MSYQELTAGISVLRNYTNKMRDHGREAAMADAHYRKVKALAILEERQKGTPATLCKDVIYSRPDVQEALTARNCTQAVYESDREAINTEKLHLRIIDAQDARDWQASGQKGY